MVFCAGQIFRGLLAFAAAAGSGTSFCPDPDQFPIFADADSWLRVGGDIRNWIRAEETAPPFLY